MASSIAVGTTGERTLRAGTAHRIGRLPWSVLLSEQFFPYSMVSAITGLARVYHDADRPTIVAGVADIAEPSRGVDKPHCHHCDPAPRQYCRAC